MIELIRTDDPVLLSWLRARLDEEGIEALVFDGHTSSVYPGLMDAVAKRVMVGEDDETRARAIVAEGRQLALNNHG